MLTFRRSVLAVAFLVVAAGMAAACSGDDTTKTANGSSTASQASIETLSARVQRNEMLFAAVNIGALPLHDMDESIAAGNVDAKFVPMTRSAVRFLALTNWSSDLKADADAVHAHAVDLLKALDDGNVAAATDPAHELHEGWHEFLDRLWGVLAKDLPADAGGVSGHHEESTTPAAGTTTSAGTTPKAGATTAAAH